jgi:hypothetical protein
VKTKPKAMPQAIANLEQERATLLRMARWANVPEEAYKTKLQILDLCLAQARARFDLFKDKYWQHNADYISQGAPSSDRDPGWGRSSSYENVTVPREPAAPEDATPTPPVIERNPDGSIKL